MWREILQLRVAHGFFDGPPPVRANVVEDPEDAHAWALDALHQRPTPAGLTVWAAEAEAITDAPSDTAPPHTVIIELHATDPSLLAVTPTQSQIGTPELVADLPAGPSEWDMPAADTPAPGLPMRRPLARLRLRLPQDGVAQMRLSLPATRAHLAYHVLCAPRAGLGIQDRDAALTFVPLGTTRLPDGRSAQSFRSDSAVALYRRVGARFSLVQDGPSGPETLISALPGPGGVTGYADGNTAQLQSDMYVTL